MRCIFCWSWDKVVRPDRCGDFYTPKDVAGRLISLAKGKRYRQVRISGNEPTIGKAHLMRVLELIPEDFLFILETNGILIGSDDSYAKDLSGFPNLHVRVSLKGTCEEEFSRLTGTIPAGFELQLRALEHLVKHGVDAHPACMVSFSAPEKIRSLRKRLKAINVLFEDFEVEELILYPSAEKRLSRMHVTYRSGYRPDSIPEGQI